MTGQTLMLGCDGDCACRLIPQSALRLAAATHPNRRGVAAMLPALFLGALVMACAAFRALPALADAPDPRSARLTLPLSCADFERRDDGAWVPQHPFTTEGVNRGVKFRGTYGINTIIRTGIAIDGIDLGALLDRQCAPH